MWSVHFSIKGQVKRQASLCLKKIALFPWFQRGVLVQPAFPQALLLSHYVSVSLCWSASLKNITLNDYYQTHGISARKNLCQIRYLSLHMIIRSRPRWFSHGSVLTVHAPDRRTMLKTLTSKIGPPCIAAIPVLRYLGELEYESLAKPTTHQPTDFDIDF